jgi:hypothetical protein
MLGPVGAACALVAAWGTTRGLRHVDVVIGAWFVIAPWVFAAGGAATANSMTVGVAMMVLALAGRRVHGRFDGGWAAVWRPVA